MPKYDFRLIIITQTLENETCLAEALFFPEVSRYGTDRKRLRQALITHVQQIVEDLPPLEQHRRRLPDTPEVGAVTVPWGPPARSKAWRKPVSLNFSLLRWRHGEAAHVAFIPALGIEIIAESPEKLEPRIIEHIQAELLRRQNGSPLAFLVWLQRGRQLQTHSASFTATVRSPKQLAARTEDAEASKKSVLAQAATDLTKEPLPEIYEMDETVAHLAEALTGPNPRSVLLVGPSGVGKTAAVHALVQRRQALQLGHTPIWATSGARLVAGMSGFGMWQERGQRLWREAAREKAILYMGHLVELMEVGKSVSNQQGIAAFLRPYIARGDALVIVECTPEQLPVIEREDPHLLNVFYPIKVEEPSPSRGQSILLSHALADRARQEPAIEMEGIEALDRLHRRYATYSAYPGRPLRFLRNLLQDRAQGSPLTAEEVTTAFARETGLPLFLLNESVRLDLEATRAWLRERVMGQPEAVEEVVNLLALMKARLTRPRKPMASLLFIGPTGVGKTEMAKALAEFLFRDRHRMIRLDMSEYADPLAAPRLIGGVFGAQGLLTAKVREQPFAVVLLDEFEKAHPLVFDLLLQVLGEGRLTDAGGRVADFCNTVVIMTSNLGAESFQRGAVGFGNDPVVRRKAAQHFLQEVRAFLRPEMFNRLDRILAFAPLDESTVLQIARRELERLTARDGIRFRPVTLRVADDVPDYLARAGFHPRYGARPLKRTIEQKLLVPLSEGLNRYPFDTALQAVVGVEEGGLRVTVRPRTADAGKPARIAMTDMRLAEITARGSELRRDIQRLERSPAWLELHNEILRLEQLERRRTARPQKSAAEGERLAQLPRRRQVAETLKSLADKIYAREGEAWLALYGKGGSVDQDRLRSEWASLDKEWQNLLLALYSLRFKDPDGVTVAVYSEQSRRLGELARAYHARAVNAGVEVSLARIVASRSGREQGMALEQQPVSQPKEWLATTPGVIGLALGLRGAFVLPRYEPERGQHIFVEADQTERCLVHTSEAPLAQYKPPAGIDRRGAIRSQERRRTYNCDLDVVDDAALKKILPWPGHALDEVLGRALEERLAADLQSLVE